MLTTRQRNKIDKAIEEIVRRRCSGMQISVLDISKVFKAGYAALEAGQDLEEAIVAKYGELAS